MEIERKHTFFHSFDTVVDTTLFREETLEAIVPDACPDMLEIIETVGIVVLTGQMSDFRNPAKCGTDTLVFVQGDTDSFTASADGNSRIALSGFNGQCQGMSKICIVAALRCIGAEVFVFPSFSFQPPLDVLFQFKSGVVGTNSNCFHFLL